MKQGDNVSDSEKVESLTKHIRKRIEVLTKLKDNKEDERIENCIELEKLKALGELSLRELSSQIAELKELIINNQPTSIPIMVQPTPKFKKFNLNLNIFSKLKSFFSFKKKITQEELKESETIQM